MSAEVERVQKGKDQAAGGARPKPLVLCVIDGLGERESEQGNAVRMAKMPRLRELRAKYPSAVLKASGAAIGLREQAPGSGELGYMHLGAGRVLSTPRTVIDKAAANFRVSSAEKIDLLFDMVKDRGCRLHLMGLLSDGGIHSSFNHLLTLIEEARFKDIPIVVHAFLDGRDVPPKTAWRYAERVLNALEDKGTIATISGRAFAMDRLGRWDRVYKTYQAIIRGESDKIDSVYDAIFGSYEFGVLDEFIEPVRIGQYEGMKGTYCADFASRNPVWMWQGEEVGLNFNLRSDSTRALSAMFCRKNIPAEVEEWLTDRKKPVYAFDEWSYVCMSDCDPALSLPLAYPMKGPENTFGEVIAKAGLRQLRCVNGAKPLHAGCYFSGGRHEAFEGEERTTVDVTGPMELSLPEKCPRMNAAELASAAVSAIQSGAYDFILVGLGNADGLAHTGNAEAVVQGLEALDTEIGRIADCVRDWGGALIVTSSHGNCEQMVDGKGAPFPGHTQSPVPLIYVNERDKDISLREGGTLSDVAPFMLEILGLEKPDVMTGQSLRIVS